MLTEKNIESFLIDNMNTKFKRASHVNWKGRVNFYLSIQNEFIKNNRLKCIVLDSFSVTHEKFLGTGNMTNILDFIENLAIKYNLPVIINSVLEPEKLGVYLKKRGYIEGILSNPASYWKFF